MVPFSIVKWFPFRLTKTSDKFSLIESQTIAVIIPYDQTAQRLLESLRYSEFPAGFARQLQRYTVGIYEREFEALLAKGVIDTLHDIYHVLNDMSLYSDQTGLMLLSDRNGDAVFFD